MEDRVAYTAKAGGCTSGGVVMDVLKGPASNSLFLSWSQAPVEERTPAWGGPESLKDKAGPKSWRGAGPALEDWGELNTG